MSFLREIVSESLFTCGHTQLFCAIDPELLHGWPPRSTDMCVYELYVDSAFAFGGEYHDSDLGSGPRVSFGDEFPGAHPAFRLASR